MSRQVMEGSVCAVVSGTSIGKSRRAHLALGKAIYAPIDEHRTAAANSDIAAAWLAVGLVGLALLAALPL